MPFTGVPKQPSRIFNQRTMDARASDQDSLTRAQVLTRFPTLKHAFRRSWPTALGVSGGIAGNNFTDPIGNVVINCGSGWTQPAAGQFRAGGATQTKSSGSYTPPGTKCCVIFCVGSLSAITVIAFHYGDATTAGISVLGGLDVTYGYVTKDATNFVTYAGLPAAVRTGVAIATNVPSKTATQYGCTASANSAAAGVPSWAGAASIDTLGGQPASNSIISDATSFLTDIYVFHPTIMPNNVAAALAWMSGNPNKIYPDIEYWT